MNNGNKKSGMCFLLIPKKIMYLHMMHNCIFGNWNKFLQPLWNCLILGNTTTHPPGQLQRKQNVLKTLITQPGYFCLN